MFHSSSSLDLASGVPSDLLAGEEQQRDTKRDDDEHLGESHKES